MFKKRSLVLLTSLCLLGSVSSCTTFFGSDSFMIKSYNITKEENGDQILTIIFDDEDQAPMVIKIPKGISGENGVGIESVVPTKSEDGTQVTITITYTDKTIKPTVISVPLIQGNDGVSVTGVDVKTDEKTGNIVIKFKYSNDTESDEIVIPKGKDGNGISSIVPSYDSKTKTTTITINFTDDSVAPISFNIKDGTDGVSISEIKYSEEFSTKDQYCLQITYSDGYVTSKGDSIYLPRPKSTKWLSGTLEPSPSQGDVGDFYLDLETGYIYQKINDTTWDYKFSMKNKQEETKTQYCTVLFNPNGGTFDGSTATAYKPVEKGKPLSLDDIPVPTYEGHTFIGWYTTKEYNVNAGKVTDLTPVFSDLTVYAWWEVTK